MAATSVNDRVARRFEELAALLDEQGANPFRVRAYQRAADTLRALDTPVTEILAVHGVEGLEALPGIGERLARATRDIARLGYFPMLERLRGDVDALDRLQTVPGIGPQLAGRLHDELGIETLEDLERAAHDGRLDRLRGFGPKRLEAVRSVLAQRLARRRPRSASPPPDEPSVEELLDVDREYREGARDGQLPTIAPRRFNPGRRAWLPILHTHRGDRHYTALFSNTALAHSLGRTRDWVIIYRDDDGRDGQWTVVTAARGAREGQRVVRGREAG